MYCLNSILVKTIVVNLQIEGKNFEIVLTFKDPITREQVPMFEIRAVAPATVEKTTYGDTLYQKVNKLAEQQEKSAKFGNLIDGKWEGKKDE